MKIRYAQEALIGSGATLSLLNLVLQPINWQMVATGVVFLLMAIALGLLRP